MEHLGRDLFHQQFQAAIILMVFDLQGHRSHSFRQKVSCYIWPTKITTLPAHIFRANLEQVYNMINRALYCLTWWSLNYPLGVWLLLVASKVSDKMSKFLKQRCLTTVLSWRSVRSSQGIAIPKPPGISRVDWQPWLATLLKITHIAHDNW